MKNEGYGRAMPSYATITKFLLVMKLTILLICFFSLQTIANDGRAQERITLNLENTSLKKVFKAIEKETVFRFVYNDDLLPQHKINIKVKEEGLDAVMKKLLNNTTLSFRVMSSNLVVVSGDAGNDAHDVRGVVTDAAGKPLSGVSVLEKGTNNGTTTADNGSFQLTTNSSRAVLVISIVGYTPQEVPVNGQASISVKLAEANNQMADVVVVGYGTQRKGSVVGAISTVKVADVKSAAPRSLNNALAGKVAGVISVQRSGEPGYDDAQFWIRGVSTFGAGANPLVLVDGVERPLNNIEPEEIESFSVLKDAAATAIYGIRGANGVILVTTRRGAREKPNISFKIERGISAPTRVPEFVDAPTYLNLYNEAQLASNPNFVTPYTPEIIAKYASGEDPLLYPNVDWIDLMMKDYSNRSRANLNIAGGGDVARYFVSASYYSEDGIWKGDNLNTYNTNAGLKRYNFRANTDINLSKRTELSLGIGGILVTGNYPGTGAPAIWQGGPNGGNGGGMMYATPVGYAPYYPNPQGNGIVYGGINGVENPYELLTGRGFATEWRNTIQSDITLKRDLSDLVKGLRIQGKFAFDGYNRHFIQRTRVADRWIATGRDPNTGELLLNRWLEGQKDLGFARQSGGNRRMYLQADLNYNRTFGDHTVGGLLLYNEQDYQDGEANAAIASLPFRLQGLVSRATYAYRNKYFLEVSAGYNGSENFKKGKRFGFFPAVAGGWVVSEEAFFEKNIKAIEYLKLRGSFGEKGNDQIGGRRFAYLTTVGNGNGGYPFGLDGNNDIGSRGEDQWGADLTWEVERELNLGFEIRFLKGFYLQADFFNRHRQGIYVQRNDLPALMGLQNNPFGNLGEFKNRGVDGTLEYRKKLGKIDLTLRGNYTYARNNLIEMNQPDWMYPYLNREGKRLNQPFGLVAEGLFVDAADIAKSPTHSFGPVRPGDIKYTDINGDGKIDNNDQVAIGNPSTPEVIYGFGTTIGYRGFDLSLFFQGGDNMDFMLGGIGFYPFREAGFRGSVSKYALDRWTVDNPSQNVLFPRLSMGLNSNNTQPSTWWQREASYLRLKTAELGYTLPKNLTQRARINTFRVYVSGFNLLTWSKFKYWDPELGSGNGAAYPIQRNLYLGLNMNF
ncbi:SusC/RagA family TonB-linked outer membrane protein [Paracnuella aquatica]|uniref:SusC/RagA family TonB-linked outer membrane protein n=1 Tax=Paracnuella aquatica TaxID=2268757 RepID=UPI000DEEABF0|nr:SusC/RagA family TonB-linked outer membrane protein [Paracnuella aquatica]RPD50717.1 SusC/RagA family TonB-linked outer membrane protein [Paracnuella aquatica]